MMKCKDSGAATPKIRLVQSGKSSLVHRPPACNHTIVPSPLHDAFITLFNTHHDCALRLAGALGLDTRAPLSQWRVVPGSFGDPGLNGKQFDADVVLAAFAPDIPDAPALAALILEPQLRFKAEKGVSWLVYRAGVGARYGTCPQWVLVLAPDTRVPLDYQCKVFPDQPELWPIFVTAGSVTPVLHQDVANASPAWAALCAALHARGPQAVAIAKVALEACKSLPAGQHRYMIDLIGAGLRKKDMEQIRREVPEETQRKWQLTEYEREGAWFIEGREEGREEGLERGREQGRAQGIRTSLLQVLSARNLALTLEQRAEIHACSDPEQLQRWFTRSLQAASAAEVLSADG